MKAGRTTDSIPRAGYNNNPIGSQTERITEDGTPTNFSVQNWLLVRIRRLECVNLKTQMEKLEVDYGDPLGDLHALSELLTMALQAQGNPVNIRVSYERTTKALNVLSACNEGGGHGRVSKEHMDKLMRYCLLEGDYQEFKDDYLNGAARRDMTNAAMGDWDPEEGFGPPLKTIPLLASFLYRKTLELRSKIQ